MVRESRDFCAGAELSHLHFTGAISVTVIHRRSVNLPSVISHVHSAFISSQLHLCSTHRSTSLLISGHHCSTTDLILVNSHRPNRCFRFASPWLWNQLSDSFRQPHFGVPTSDSPHLAHTSSSSSVDSPLSPSFTSSLFHSRLKTHKSICFANHFHLRLPFPLYTSFNE